MSNNTALTNMPFHPKPYVSICKQEAQLMLTTPCDTMFYVNRVSAYLVPFFR